MGSTVPSITSVKGMPLDPPASAKSTELTDEAWPLTRNWHPDEVDVGGVAVALQLSNAAPVTLKLELPPLALRLEALPASDLNQKPPGPLHQVPVLCWTESRYSSRAVDTLPLKLESLL